MGEMFGSLVRIFGEFSGILGFNQIFFIDFQWKFHYASQINFKKLKLNFKKIGKNTENVEWINLHNWWILKIFKKLNWRNFIDFLKKIKVEISD